VYDRLTGSDVLALESLRNEILGYGGIGATHEHAAHEVATEDVDHYEQRKSDAFLRPANFSNVAR